MMIGISIAIFMCLVIVQVIVKNKNPIRKTFAGIFLGLFSLLAVNLTGIFTGVVLPISFLSIAISCVMGIPGVTMMLILNLII